MLSIFRSTMKSFFRTGTRYLTEIGYMEHSAMCSIRIKAWAGYMLQILPSGHRGQLQLGLFNNYPFKK